MANIESRGLERDDVVARYGPWTAHNIRLGEGVYTISPEPAGDEVKLRRIVQLVSDLHGGRIEGLRILDLASLEGMYALELARRGAEVVAIEGREANVEKARFAARALDLDVDFQLGDVRNLSLERHGPFDVVLCLGILYHLDAADVVSLVGSIRQVVRSVAIFDTAVALSPTEIYRDGDLELHGERLVEHELADSEERRLARLWSSLDNLTAFVPTLPSILRLLDAKGFTSVLEAHLPAEPDKPHERVTLVAFSGTPVVPILAPPPPPGDIPERRPSQRVRSVRDLIPAPIRRAVRRTLGIDSRRL